MQTNPQEVKRFLISHFLFLISLLLIYFIPKVCSLPETGLLPPMDKYIRFYIIALFSISFLLYYLYLYFYNRSNQTVFNIKGLSLYFWAVTIALFLFLCSSRAVLSTDLYEYSLRGRMGALYGLNPYLHLPSEIKLDIFYPYLFWKNTPESYGPAWVLIGYIHTYFFQTSLFLTSFIHKIILGIFLLLTSYVFYKLSTELNLNNAGQLTLAFLTNPLVIVTTLIDGHNEIVMVFFFLICLYFLYREKYVFSIVAAALSVQVKFVYILLLPLVGLYAIFGPGHKSKRRRIYELVIGSIVSLAVIFLLWRPFGWESVSAVIDYYKELSTLFWGDSIPYVFYFIFDKLKLPISMELLTKVFSALFLALYIYIIRRFWGKIKSDRQAIFNAFSLIILALFFTNYSPFQAWYLLWVIPFILLSGFRTRFALFLLLTFFLIMTFWKRMSVLAIPMMFLYGLLLLKYDSLKQRLNFFFTAE